MSTRILVTLSMALLVLGGLANAQATSTKLLTFSELRSVRGSAPGDCTGSWTYRPCSEDSDSFWSCWKYDGDKAGCQGMFLNDCKGCDADNEHQQCGSGRPWNAICDPVDNGKDPKGCGVKWNSPTCQWNDAKLTCRCKSDVVTKDDCERLTAKRTDDPVKDPCKIVTTP